MQLPFARCHVELIFARPASQYYRRQLQEQVEQLRGPRHSGHSVRSGVAVIEISRRMVVLSGGATVAGLVLAVSSCAPSSTKPLTTEQIGNWLAIAPDGFVTVRVNSTDVGQGAQTGLAQIVADELGAEWSKIRVEMAPVTDAYIVKDGGYYTGGSSSIRPQFEMFRQIGATARSMLIAAAARKWLVAPSDCSTENGNVRHDASGRTLKFGALATAASALPIPEKVSLKQAVGREFIGTSMPRLDIPDKVTGRAIYGIDVKLPEMRTATLAQCPYFGGKLVSVDEGPALAVKGVEHVVKLEKSVVVVARNFIAAKKGLGALSPKWSKSSFPVMSRELMYDALRADIGSPDSRVLSRDPTTTNATLSSVNAALASAPVVIEAEYQVQLLAHATMEPMNATAVVTDKSCELWAPMQNQGDMRNDLAKALNLSNAQIKLNTTKVGGGFGRRLQTDYGVLAALASKAVGKPVKLIWTREEDFTHDFYRPASVARVKAVLDSNHLIRVLDYTGATSNDTAIGGFSRNYNVPDVIVRQKQTTLEFPVGSWRSVDPSITVFFIESLVDEVANRVGLDPLDYRRKLLSGDPRHLRVLNTAAEMANWGHAAKGHFQGIAFFGAAYWGTSVAHVIELSVGSANKITMHRVCCAIDPGMVINPNQVAAQAEGGIILGLSAALGEEISIREGRVEQTNFDGYPVLRLAQIPRIDVKVLESAHQAPGGVGEPPVPPVAPALANAIFAATGKRIRVLPLVRNGFTV